MLDNNKYYLKLCREIRLYFCLGVVKLIKTMRILTVLVFSIIILSLASCVVTGGQVWTRVEKYVDIDTSSNKVVSDTVELYYKGQALPQFDYEKVARITITGGKDDNSVILLSAISKKAKELFCDALVYVEINNTYRHYSTFNPFWEGIDEEITVQRITGLAVKKRFVDTDSIP